MYLSK